MKKKEENKQTNKQTMFVYTAANSYVQIDALDTCVLNSFSFYIRPKIKYVNAAMSQRIKITNIANICLL